MRGSFQGLTFNKRMGLGGEGREGGRRREREKKREREREKEREEERWEREIKPELYIFLLNRY